jgi:hypothetical protein
MYECHHAGHHQGSHGEDGEPLVEREAGNQFAELIHE